VAAATELRTGPLAAAHAEVAERLSAEAGWNQTAADWRHMIGYGEAWGQFAPDGTLVASALLLPYDARIAWIAMVLTTAAWRRRGLATANLRRALERCAALGVTAGLDATPAGREVYRPLGFADVFTLRRWSARTPALSRAAASAVLVRPMAEPDLDAAADLDGRAFGAQRRPLMAYLLGSEPTRAIVALRADRLAGFVLARSGCAALHLGPLIAPDAATATLLMQHALIDVRAPVSIDVPDAQIDFGQHLANAGFMPARPFTRMVRAASAPGDPRTLFALAGPEFG
jgi:hypothetical protein